MSKKQIEPKEPAPQVESDAATLAANEKADKEARHDISKITATLMARPSFMSAHTAMSFIPDSMKAYGPANILTMHEEYRDKCKAVVEGDMTTPEALLISQAMSLNSIYNECAQLAGLNIANRLPQAEVLLRMALKAQAQCTQTLRVLGELKAPKSVAFIKQQNNAAGPQQVNNGPVTQGAAAMPARAHEKEDGNPANELLTDEMGAQHAATLDTGATRRAGGKDPQMETVGAVDRTCD
ncbi:hypothetical protein VSR69_33065 [Paraburkholderia phytofirmans]|uniref:hypothetical protein n=1 Tax=Paraburkholderia sp. BL9I2N2 TaxID=1938809 RepID=UPI0010433594|nr:hypothetical protein [Paraburkholderia sp. BL9I2N2]TCK96008.1 hypothetical protein B0G74_2651 [Paraburkholderia sp. BL9I2N2]